MKEIRNDCRYFMTNDQQPISTPQQAKWYERYRKDDNLRAFLGSIQDTPIRYPVAFGLIRHVGDRDWITGGVRQIYRGKGYGHRMFQFLTETARKPAYLDVLVTNIKAIALYGDLGWNIEGHDIRAAGEVIVMWHD